MGDGAKHASTRRLKTREQLFPGSGTEVFDPTDRATKGYAQVPRVVPIVARLINERGGVVNAGPLYQVLWAQDWGQGIVEVRSYRQLLFEAGYNGKGSRVERTWEERIRILQNLGFIRTAKRGLDTYGYILLVDPHVAALRLERATKSVPALKDWFVQFRLVCEQWGIDLGALDAKASVVPTGLAS